MFFWDRQQRGAIDEPLTLPAWIAQYLCESADEIMTLADGIDARIEPATLNFEVLSPEQVMSHPDWKADLERRRIDADKAIDLVPRALGLRKDGGNAFKELNADASKMQEFRSYEMMRSQGMSMDTAIEQMQSIFGRKAFETRKSRINSGRKLATGKGKNRA
jgi:hypothetical protein